MATLSPYTAGGYLDITHSKIYQSWLFLAPKTDTFNKNNDRLKFPQNQQTAVFLCTLKKVKTEQYFTDKEKYIIGKQLYLPKTYGAR